MVDYSGIFPIAEYYKKVVVPLGKRFQTYKKDKFVCCLHDDTDPSFGIIQTKDNGEIFHCFGCNAWGNVVDLHKRVSLKYFNKSIDSDRALVELCSIFNIDIKEVPREEEDFDISSVSDRYVRRQLAMRNANTRFDIGDFQRGIVDGKISDKGIPYYNTLLVRMINEYKDS